MKIAQLCLRLDEYSLSEYHPHLEVNLKRLVQVKGLRHALFFIINSRCASMSEKLIPQRPAALFDVANVEYTFHKFLCCPMLTCVFGGQHMQYGICFVHTYRHIHDPTVLRWSLHEEPSVIFLGG